MRTLTIEADNAFTGALVDVNPYMTMTRDELAEQVELLAAALATSTKLRGEEKLHAITEAEMELADARVRTVVDLHRRDSGYWSWARIGDALGISRQGARKTYGPHVERACLSDDIRRELGANL